MEIIKLDICKESLIDGDGSKNFHIDHNHTTEKVRGLLCSSCNLALGHAKEDKEVLKSMIEYLERFDG